MENGTFSQGEGKDPSAFLAEIIGSPVVVKLNSGVVYRGQPLSTQLRSPRLNVSFQESFNRSMDT